MASIGSVTITVEGDASRVPGDVEKQTRGPLTKIGASLGKALGDGLASAAKLTGATIAGVLGTSLAKGMGRLTAIDNAEASLRGLTATANHVPEVMDAALASVKGTAFGLGQAATAATQFASAGVPISEMERHLSALAKSAAGAGGDFDGMSSIFAKVAARGNVTSEVLNQLTDRGVAGLAALATHFGVTAEEAQKMVSAGEVSFDDFSQAMDAAMGDVAAEQAATFSGLMSNVGASMGRMGAELQKPIFNALKAVMPGVINLFDQFTDVIVPIAEIIASRLQPAAEKLGDMLKGLSFGADASAEGASNFLSALVPLLPAIGGLLGMMGPLLTNLPVIGPLFSGISGPVGILAGALVALLAFDSDALTSGFSSIADALPGIISKIVSQVATLVPAMAQRLAENLPVFVTGILDIITAVIPAIAEAIPVLVETFAQLIPQLITTLLGAVPLLLQSALQLFQSIIQAIITVLPLVIETLIALLPEIAAAILTALPLIIAAALELFMGVVTAIVEAVPVIIDAVLELLPVLLETVLGMLPDLIEAALELFLGVVTGLLEAIPQILIALLDMLPQLLTTIIGMIPQLIQAAVQLFTGIIEALPIILPELITALIELAPVMVETLIGLIPQLIEAGVSLIGGLVQGLWNAASSIGSALLEIAKNAIGDFLGFLGIASPSKLFASFGGDIGAGLVQGISGMADEVDKALVDLVPPEQSLRASLTAAGTSLAPGAAAEAMRAGATGASVTYDQRTVEAPVSIVGPDPYRAAVEVADRIAERIAV